MRHVTISVLPADANLERLRRIFILAHERHPEDFEQLLGTANVGPATIRNAPISRRDPTMPPSPLDPEPEGTSERRWADYSSAHGGKDGHPFPVDRKTYDRNIVVLTEAVCKARLGQTDKAKVTIATGTVSICCDVDRCRHCPSWR